MTRKTLWRPVALALLLGMHTAWADMTDVQAKALAVSAYRHAGSRSGTSALETLMRAADGGAPAAQYWLGAYFDSSHLYVKANYWFGKAAEQGLSDAQFNLGVHYANGRGVPIDYAKANYWYVKAAEQGDADAQNNLGFDYKYGKGVPQDYAKANYWYAQAAAHGDAMAQYNLGADYDKGKGVPQDYAKANYWFAKAAEQGYADAQYNLGVHYANGRGVPRDYAKANYWYAKAAEQGYADAQNNLGFDYYNGHGVPQDTMRAIYWWRKAAAQGSRMAERNIQIAERGTAASNDAARAVTYTDTCVNASCVRRYSDGRVIRYTACLNPADGLPMNDPNQLGGCGGTDSDGNFYGTGS